MKIPSELASVKTLPELLDYCEEKHKGKTAFSFFKGKDSLKEVSFCAFKNDVSVLASYLSKLGLFKKKIAIVSGNSTQWLEAFFAVSKIGSTAVLLDRELSENDILSLFKRADCEAVFYSSAEKDKIELIKEKESSLAFICLERLPEIIKEEKNSIPFSSGEPLSENDTAVIVFTSGTTGKSKGVMLSQKNIVSNAIACFEVFEPFKKAVHVLPLHHTFGLTAGILVPMLLGCNVLISKSVRRFQKDMEFFKPEVVIIVPIIAETMLKKIWATAEAQGQIEKLKKGIKISNFLLKFSIDKRRKIFSDVLSSFGGELKTIVCGGAPLGETTVKDFCSFGIDLRNGYGITECSPVVCVNGSGKRNNKLSSVGTALSCCEIRIKQKDENGIGEIEVKGSNVMLGYLGDEEETKAVFDGSWFKTGDLGKTEKGYIYITGRAKNLIILSNGKNVSPEEIEQKLLEHGEIEEIVVFENGGKICAEIYSPEADSNKINSIVDEFNKTVPAHKNIEKVTVRNTPFPKTATMKIKRNKEVNVK